MTDASGAVQSTIPLIIMVSYIVTWWLQLADHFSITLLLDIER